MAKRSADLAAIEVEIERIRSLDLDALRAEWRKAFKRAAPSCLTKDILGRMIAYRLQGQAFGGLDRKRLPTCPFCLDGNYEKFSGFGRSQRPFVARISNRQFRTRCSSKFALLGQ